MNCSLQDAPPLRKRIRKAGRTLSAVMLSLILLTVLSISVFAEEPEETYLIEIDTGGGADIIELDDTTTALDAPQDASQQMVEAKETSETPEGEAAAVIGSMNETFTNDEIAATDDPVELALGEKDLDPGYENAVQKAVNAVINKAAIETTVKSAVITVAPGTYLGDINIEGENLDDFTLTIKADDVDEAAPADSAGEAVITGNIIVSNINLIMMGLYLDQQSAVKAKNAVLSVYGSGKSDTLNLWLDNSSATISTGAGNDTVKIKNGGTTEGFDSSVIPEGAENILISGDKYTVNGNLGSADSVELEGKDITVNADILADMFRLSAEDRNEIVQSAENKTANAAAKATINGEITASEDIAVSTKSTAVIKGAGKTTLVSASGIAVYGKLKSVNGAVTLKSESDVTVESTAYSNSASSDVTNETYIKLGSKAEVNGAAGVTMDVDSKTSVKTESKATDTSAQTVLKHDTTASSEGNIVSGAGIDITADSEVEVTTDAKSNATSIIAVTDKATADAGSLTLNGELAVKANSEETVSTTGVTSAYDTVSVDTQASVADSVAIKGTVAAIDIESNDILEEEVKTETNSDALLNSGVNAAAYLGAGPDGDGKLDVNGNVTVLSNSFVTRNVTSLCEDAYVSTAASGANSVSVMNDSCTAVAQRNVKAQNLTVKTSNTRTNAGNREHSTAGSTAKVEKGVANDDPSHPADSEIENILRKASEFSALISAEFKNNFDALVADRQKAETAEGTVEGILAYALSIGSFNYCAKLGGNVEGETVSVSSETELTALTDAKVKSTKGIFESGAAAIGQLFYLTDAKVDGTVNAESLKIIADSTYNLTNNAFPGGKDLADYAGVISILRVNADTNAVFSAQGNSTIENDLEIKAQGNGTDKSDAKAVDANSYGSAFALLETAANAKAALEGSGAVEAKNAAITANSVHNASVNSVAGREVYDDPAFDASDAVLLLGDNINATLGEDAKLTVTGANRLTISASGSGSARTNADVLDCGGDQVNDFIADNLTSVSAKGAVAAVSVLNSKVSAKSLGTVNTAVETNITANSNYSDDTYAGIAISGAEKIALEDDTYTWGETEYDGKKGTATSALINSWLDEFKHSENINTTIYTEVPSSVYGAPVSFNTLLTQDARTIQLDFLADDIAELLEPLIEAIFGDIEADINDNAFISLVSKLVDLKNEEGKIDLTGDILEALVGALCGDQYVYAASTAALITSRASETVLGGEMNSKGISSNADNYSNFKAEANGEGMTNGSLFGVGRAIAHITNLNSASAEVLSGAKLNADGANLVLKANLVQNMDSAYKKDYTARAIAGRMNSILSMINQSSTWAQIVISFIGTALTTIANASVSSASVGEGASIINGGDISVVAEDQTHLAAKSGNVVDETTSGAGGGHAVIFASSTVSATVGDNAEISGKSFALKANKKAVTNPADDTDYVSAFHDAKLVTTDATGADKGHINVMTGDDTEIQIKNGDMFVVGTQALSEYLEKASYYVEANNGAICNGGEDYQEGGAVATLVYNNKVYATVGEGASITTSQGSGITVTANVKADARVIGGVREKLDKNLGTGTSTATFFNNDKVWTEIGSRSILSSSGAYTQDARSNYDTLAIATAQLPYSVEMKGLPGKKYKAKATSPSVFYIARNETKSSADDSVDISAHDNLTVSARSHQLADLALKSDSVDDRIGDLIGENAVSGSCMSIYANFGESAVKVGDSAKLNSTAGDVTVYAYSSDNVTASLECVTFGFSKSSGGATSGKGKQGATNLVVNFSKTSTSAIIGEKSQLIANEGNISVVSEARSISNSLSEGASFGSKSSGMGIIASAFMRTNKTEIGKNATLVAGKDIIVATVNDDYSVDFAVAFAASLSIEKKDDAGGSMTVCIGATFSKSDLLTAVRSGAKLTAGGSVSVDADLQSENNIFTGGVNASLNGGIGIALDAGIYFNTIETVIEDDAVIVAKGQNGQFTNRYTNRAQKRNGVYVNAKGFEKLLQIAVSVSAGGKDSTLNGVINAIVEKNNVTAKMNGKAVAGYESAEAGAEVTCDASDVIVEADDEAAQRDFAGGLSVSGKGAKGATVLAIVYMKNVSALLSSGSEIIATGDAIVHANGKDDLWLLTIACSVGATGSGIAGDVNAVIFKDTVRAVAEGTITAGGNIEVLADSDSKLLLIGVGVGGSAGGSGATAVVVFTYFVGTTEAIVKAGSNLSAGGSINVIASSKENTSPDAGGLGLAGGGTAVAGTVDVIISKVNTLAYTENNVSLNAGNSISVLAQDNYKLLAIVVSAAAGSGAGISLGVLVSLAFNNVNAYLGAANTVKATGGSVTVKADTLRDINSYVASAAGGSTGAAPAVNVVIAGSKLSKNASDAIGQGSFNLDACLNKGLSANPSAKDADIGSLDEDMAPDTTKAEDVKPEGGWNDYGQGSDFSGGAGEIDPETANDSNTPDTDANPTQGVEGDDLGNLNLPATLNRKDAAAAYIGNLTTVEAGGDINVIASDCLCADILAGSVGVGGTGIGIGVTVAVLYSSVSAEVCEGAKLSAEGNVTVKASSGSQEKAIGDPFADMADNGSAQEGGASNKSQAQENRADANNRIKEDNGGQKVSDSNTSTIRVISLSVAAGGTGIGAAVAVMNVFTDVKTNVAGEIEAGGNCNVDSVMEYGEVIAVVLGVAAGGTGIAGSVGFVNYRGTVDNRVASSAKIQAANLTVKTTGTTSASVAAASLAAGGVGAAAGVALVFNHTNIENCIAGGAEIKVTDKVTALVDFTGAARAFIISVAVGGTGIGAAVSVVFNSLSAYNYLGTRPGAAVGAVSTVYANDVEVRNDLKGKLIDFGFGISAGGVAGNGIVAICHNDVVSYAAIRGMNVESVSGGKANSVVVDSKINGDAEVTSTSIVGGGVGLGASVVIAKVGAKSVALVDLYDSQMFVKNLTVGESPCVSQVFVTEISVTAGGIAGSLNLGLAINKASFLSNLTGSANGYLLADNVKLEMNGNAYADSVIATASAGGVAVSAGVAIALLKASQQAVVDGSAVMVINSLTVKSTQNLTFTGTKSFVLTFGTIEVLGKTFELKLLEMHFDTMAEAFLYSVKIGAISIGCNVVIAVADATCAALVDAANLTVGNSGDGALNVTSQARSDAKASTEEFGLLNDISGGAMVGYAYANGTVKALVSSHNNGTITAKGGVSILADYNATSTVSVKPACGGVANIKVNVAIAKVRTKAYAGVEGSGTIDAGSAPISIVSKGTVLSKSQVLATMMNTSTVNVAASVVFSKLQADQQAYAKGVNLKGGSLQVLSYYNAPESGASAKPGVPGISESKGAFATVGASLASANAVSIKLNLAFALSSSNVKAVIGNAGIDVSGDAYVNTIATSYSHADVAEPVFSLEGLSAALNYLYSDASGSYDAGIDSGSGKDALIKANNLYVATSCNTKSYSRTGSVGAAAGLIDAKVNIARANVLSNASAYVKGNGGAEIANNLSVFANGTGLAYTRVFTPVVSYNLVGIAANDLESNLKANQSATTDIGGNVTVGGRLSVESKFDCSSSGADSQVGTSVKGLEMSALSVKVSNAYAKALLNNKANLSGNGGTIKAGSVAVIADSKTNSKAVALAPVSAAAAEISVNFAEARTADVTEASIGNGKAFNLSSDSTVDVLANSSTVSYTEFASGGGVSLLGVTVTDVISYVGKSGSEPQTVRAFIAPNAHVTAKGNITVSAYNTGYVSGKMTSGFKVSAIHIDSTNVRTKAWYLTEAYVDTNASVESTEGNVTIKAEDFARANSKVDGSSVGILLSADLKYAMNELVSTVNATLKPGASVIGYNEVLVTAISNADMNAYTHANTGGLFAKGSLTAKTYLGRKVKVALKGAYAESRTGNLNVIAEAGRKDNIITKADGSAAGLAGIGGAKVTAQLTSDVSADVEDGSHLYADFGTVNVKAMVAEQNARAVGDYSAAGLVGKPDATVNFEPYYSQTGTLSAVVNLNNSFIRGRYVNVASELKELYLEAYTHAKVGGAGGKAKADSKLTVNINVQANVNNSEIVAYTKASLWTNASPTSSGTNIKVYSNAYLIAAGGWVGAYSTLNGYANSTLNISGSTFRAYSLSMNTTKFGGNISTSAERTGHGLVVIRKRGNTKNFSKNEALNVNACEFYISGGATGIRADVDIKGQVHCSGASTTISGTVADGVVTVSGILRPLGAGSISAPKADLSTSTIYNCGAYFVEFTNYYEGTVKLPSMDLSMTEAETGTMRINAKKYGTVKYYPGEGDDYVPYINITSYNGGNIQFANVVCNESGITNIVWEGEPGNILSMNHNVDGVDLGYLWTHILNIVNVRNIGEASPANDYSALDEEGNIDSTKTAAKGSYFQVLLSRRNGANPEVHITEGKGDFFLQPVLALITRMNTLSGTFGTPEGEVDLNEITTTGLIDIFFDTPVALNYLPGASGFAAEPVNNTPVFLSATSNATVTLTPDELLRYYVGTEDGVMSYELPDGTMLYTDELGTILRIGTEEPVLDENGSVIIATEIVAILDEDGFETGETETKYIRFNYTTGVLTIDAGFPYDYVVYIDQNLSGYVTPSNTVKTIKILEQEEWGVDDDGNNAYVKADVLENFNLIDLSVAENQRAKAALLKTGSDCYNDLRNGSYGDYTGSAWIDKISIYELDSNYFNSNKATYLVMFEDEEYVGTYTVTRTAQYNSKNEFTGYDYSGKRLSLFEYVNGKKYNVSLGMYSLLMGQNDDGEDIYESFTAVTVTGGGQNYRLTYSTATEYRTDDGQYISGSPLDDGKGLALFASTAESELPLNIKLKATDGIYWISKELAENPNGGYDVVNSLRISNDGTVYSKTGDVTVTYNKAKNSMSVQTVETVTSESGDTTEKNSTVEYNNGTVTLTKSDLRLEQLSTYVAKTADGQYWYYALNGNDYVWVPANYSNGIVSYKGTPVLGIRTEDDNTVFTTYENGEKRFDVTMDGSEVVESKMLFVAPKTMECQKNTSTSSTLTTAGFNIGVVTSGAGGENENGNMWLRYSEAEITMKTLDPSVYNFISSGSIYEFVPEKATFNKGTELEQVRYETNTKGEGGTLYFCKEDGSDYKEFVGSQRINIKKGSGDYQFKPGSVIKEGSTFTLNVEDGKVTAIDLGVESGAFVSISAHKIDSPDGGSVTIETLNIAEDAQFLVSAEEDINIGSIRSKEAEVDLISLNSGFYADTIILDGGSMNVTVRDDIVLSQANPGTENRPVTATNGAMINFVSTAGSFIGDYPETDIAQDDRVIYALNGASIAVQAAEKVVLTKAIVRHGTVSLESTNGDVYFDLIDAQYNVLVAANGNILPIHDGVHSTIILRDKDYQGERYDGIEVKTDADNPNVDTTSTVTLRAAGDIGLADRWLYLDCPETVTPVIQLATNFYIDGQAQKTIDWNLYRYWVSNGYAIDKLNILFGEYDRDAQTRLDFIAYSDIQYFRSLLDLGDNEALAAWIRERAEDINDDSFMSYLKNGDNTGEKVLELLLNSLLFEEEIITEGDPITAEDINKLSKVEKVEELITYVKAALDAREAEIKESDSSLSKAEIKAMLDAESKDIFVAKTVEAITQNTISDKGIEGVLEVLLDDSAVEYDGSLANLVNYLFKTSSFYASDLNELLNNAVEVAQKSAADAEKAYKDANSSIAAGRDARKAALSARNTALDNLYSSISEGLDAATPKEGGVSDAQRAALYNEIRNLILDDYFLDLANDSVKNTDAQKSVTETVKTKLESLNSGKSAKNSAEAIVAAANVLFTAQADMDDSGKAVDELLNVYPEISERYHELNDEFQTDESAAQIAKELDEILRDGGSMDKAVKAYNDAAAAYGAADAAFVSASEADAAAAEKALDNAYSTFLKTEKALFELIDRVYELSNTHYDQMPDRSLNLKVGEMFGQAYLYNSGNITITVDPENAYSTIYSSIQQRAQEGLIKLNKDRTTDFTVGNIRSEYGDVSITNNGGSILGAELSTENEIFAKQELIYRNDGVTYPFRYDTGVWYQMNEDGEWEEITDAAILDSVDNSEFAKSRFEGSVLEGQNLTNKMFEKVHIYSNALTLNARDNIGSEDQLFLVETHESNAEKLFYVGGRTEDFRDLDLTEADIQKNIYDGILGSNFVEDNLLAALETLDNTAHLTSLVGGESFLKNMTVNGQLIRAYNDYDSSVYGPNDDAFQLKEVTLTDESGKTVTTWGLDLYVRYFWVRSSEDTARVNATAETGSIYMEEYSGNVDAGEISAAEDILYTVPGDIHDGRTEEQKEADVPNFASGGSTVINIPSEADFGTKDDTLTVATNQLDVVGDEDKGGLLDQPMYLNTQGDVTLTGRSAESHYEVNADGNFTLNDANENTDVLSGFVNGDANVGIYTNGDIGTETKPFEVTTGDFADFGFAGDNVYLDVDSNVTLTDGEAKGDLKLDVNGSVVDGSDTGYNDLMDELLDKQDIYNDAVNALNKTEGIKARLDNLEAREEVERTEQALEEANAAAETAAQALDNAVEAKNAAQETYDAVAEEYGDKVKAGTATEADLEKLVKAEETLAEKTADAQNAQNELDAANAEAEAAAQAHEAAVTKWETEGDYVKIVQDARENIANAKENLSDAQTAEAEAQQALQAAVAAGDEDTIKEAQKNLETAQENVTAAETALADTLAAVEAVGLDPDNLPTDAELEEMGESLEKLIAEQTAEKLEAERNLEDMKTLMEAQVKANDANYENRDNPSEINENTALAADYVLSAAQLVVDVENGKNTEVSLEEAKELLAEAEKVMELVERGNDFLENYDEAYARQAGLTEDSTEEEKREAVAKQQADALAVLEAANLLAGDSTEQNKTSLAAARDLAEASDDAYNKQVAEVQAEEALKQAQDRKEAADQALAELLKDKDISDAEILKKAEKDDKIRDAYLETLNAADAVAEAEAALDAAQKVLDEANDKLEAKQNIDEAVSKTNELIAQRDAAQADLNEKKAEQTKLDKALADAKKDVKDDIAAITGANGLIDVLQSDIQTKLHPDYNIETLEEIRDAVNNGENLTATLDSLNEYTAQVVNRMMEEYNSTDEKAAAETAQIGKELEDLYNALVELGFDKADEKKAQTAADDIAEQVKDAGETLNDLKSQLADAQTAQTEAISDNGGIESALPEAKEGNAAAEDRSDENPTLKVGGDADITTEGSFGEEGKDLAVEVGGNLNVESDGDISVRSGKDVNLEAARAEGDATVTALGDVNNTSEDGKPVITGENVEINALDGEIGSDDKPMTIDADSLSGNADDMYVRNSNNGTTVLGDINVEDEADLSFGGSVVQEDDAILRAKDLSIAAEGDIIGERSDDDLSEIQNGAASLPGNPAEKAAAMDFGKALNVNTENLNISGKDVSIHSIGKDMAIDSASYDTINLTATGHVDPKDTGIEFNNMPTALAVFARSQKGPDMMRVDWVADGSLGALFLELYGVDFIFTELRLGDDAASEILKKAANSKHCLGSASVSAVLRSNGAKINPWMGLVIKVDGLEDGTEVFALQRVNGQLIVLRGVVYKGYALFDAGNISVNGSDFVVVTAEGLAELGINPASAIYPNDPVSMKQAIEMNLRGLYDSKADENATHCIEG